MEMPHKADKQDLIDLENRIMDKLNQMMKQIHDKFATKDELIKRFNMLNKKIKEIMDILARQGNGEHEDDAMFSKKPLGPMNCASCDKNLVNMIGMPAEYYTWKRLPFRDPTDRIARFG